jgi:hypothetical protein
MEVHHHSHHPKKWKEYLTEFVMLFVAVTLGFFAENQREHFVERHREVEYMESLMEDLSKDKEDLNAAKKFTEAQVLFQDTAISILSKRDWNRENILTLYRASLKIAGNRPATFIERTSSQLKSGGMRLITDKHVATLISEYWQLIDQFNEYENGTMIGFRVDVKNMTYKIFDGTNYLDPRTRIIKEDANLMTYDKNTLIEYNNRLLNLNYDTKKFGLDLFSYKLLRKVDELQVAIHKSYHIPIK